jgi:hypothetical protein
MSDTLKEETTPDQLMKHFQGSSLKSIIIFTLIVHAVLLAVTSAPYLYKKIVGEDPSGKTEKEKMELAVKEAKDALGEIADKYGMTRQDLSSRFVSGAPKAPKTPKTDSDSKGSQDDPGTDPEKPKSAIEEELNKKATGPALPKPEDDENLFE